MLEGKRKPRIGRLDNVGGVITEMSRVYRLAARDELDDKKAARLVGMLAEIRRALELGEMERRIAALEERRRKRTA